MGLLAAAGVASRSRRTRTGGRDAVRLVGRPALAVPGLSFRAAAAGRWPASALAWGPLYEPHRFPTGAPLAERLRPSRGPVRLVVKAEVSTSRPDLPDLRLQGPRCGGSRPPFARVPEAGAPVSSFRSPDRDLTPLVEGGGAFLAESLELRVQP